jgi:NAD(P)-dependent dehydrogenase (short-subunit alcohol dehydrogenase family)
MYTADEVLHGIDLTGRTAVVTGGYSGVGLAITRALNRAGARVIVPARRPDVARRNLGATAETAEMDLGDLSSVDAFAASYLRRHRTQRLACSALRNKAPPRHYGPLPQPPRAAPTAPTAAKASRIHTTMPRLNGYGGTRPS